MPDRNFDKQQAMVQQQTISQATGNPTSNRQFDKQLETRQATGNLTSKWHFDKQLAIQQTRGIICIKLLSISTIFLIVDFSKMATSLASLLKLVTST